MPDDKHILLQKWLRGETTAREEAQLAAWAREDPFLADALEGYAGLPEADHAQRMEQLKKRLAGRRESRKPIRIWWPRIAAAAAVLLLAVAGFWWINTGNREAGVAQEMEAPAPPEADALPADTLTEKAPTPTPTTKSEDRTPKLRSAPNPPGNKKRRAAPMAEPRPSAAEEDLAGAEPTDRMERTTVRTRSDVPAGRILSGQVTNAEGDPLVGATIFLPRPERIATTDLNGYFNLPIPDTVPAELIVSYTGFQSRRVAMPDTNFQRIALQPGSAPLTEAQTRTSRQPAEPMGGYLRLKQYLAAGKRYPVQAAENNIRGTVILSFRVDENGRPRDIRVEQSLGYGCDAEALRLLQEGPDWVPPTMARNRLEIDFP